MARRKSSKVALAGRVVEALTAAVRASPDNLGRLADSLGIKASEVHEALDEAKKIVGRSDRRTPSGAKVGRPSKVDEVAYMEATMSRCSLDDWLEIVERAVEEAKDGDRDARAWLAKQLGTEAPVKTQARVDATVRGPLEVVFVDDWKPPLDAQEPPRGPGSTPAAAPSPG